MNIAKFIATVCIILETIGIELDSSFRQDFVIITGKTAPGASTYAVLSLSN